MPSLFKRGKYYHIKFNQDGKEVRQSTGCRSKAEANLFLRSFDPKIKSSIRLDTLRREALQYSQRLNKAMQWQYKQTLDRFYSFAGNKLLIEIGKTSIDNFIVHLKTLKTVHNKPYSTSSINMNIAVLKRCFQIAIDNDWISSNPVRVKKLHNSSVVPEFTTEEANILLNSLKQLPDLRYYQATLIAFNSGLRLGEVCSLSTENVDFEAGTIKLQNKINKKPEYAFLNDVTMSILQERLKLIDISGKFFNLNKGYLSKQITKHIKKTGLNSKLHFHSTRHTFLTEAEKQHGILVASRLARHANVSTTQRYCHRRDSELKEKARMIEIG